MLKDLRITEFLSSTTSKSPVPGGGSVSALVGAVAASLSAMVAGLTIGKNKYVEVEEDMKALLDEAIFQRDNLIMLIDRDSEAFNEVMAAYKLPKETVGRSLEIKNALITATETPFAIASASLEVMRLSQKAHKMGNKNAESDALVSCVMARSAVYGALMNVNINLESIDDELFVSKYKSFIHLIKTEADMIEEEMLGATSLI